MSNYKLIAVAIAAALAAPAAFAGTFTSPATTPNLAIHAQEAVKDAAATASNAGVLTYTLTAGDFLVGRTTAFKVEITLSNAEYAGTGTVATTSQGNYAVSNSGSTGNLYSFTMAPSVAGAVAAGDLFTFQAADFDVTKLPTTGGSVTATIKFRDLATGLELQSTTGTPISVSAGTKVSATAEAAPAKIDVTLGKTKFVGGGNLVQLGKVDVDFVDGDSASAGTQNVSIEGSGIVANGDNALTKSDLIQYSVGLDKLALTVTAGDAAAFTPISGNTATNTAGIYVGVGVACTTGGTKLTQSTTNPNEFTGSIGIPNATTPTAFNICAQSNNVTQITDKGFTASGKIDFSSASMVDKSFGPTALATLAYNGPVVRVMHFNPASNTSQVSYLRISNTSSVGGKVTIEGVCDGGTSGTPSSVTLDANKSMLLTSTDVENGGRGLTPGLGTCPNTNGSPANKYRLTITGEVGSMEVQNFLRNINSAGTVTGNINNKD